MKPRVLVIDDSARSRAQIAELLEEGGCEVVGRAMDGGLALRLALERKPDVITCDLEMPRMDGFTFIRLLQARQPTPIIVVTSDARPEAALQALDLGARDFVVKPGPSVGDLRQLGPALVSKVHALALGKTDQAFDVDRTDEVSVPSQPRLALIGASTGGPSAVRDLMHHFVRPAACPVVIAQHMPTRFTRAFADRLARSSKLDVREAEDGDILTPGVVRIGPGGLHTEVVQLGSELTVRLSERTDDDRWAPSVDRLFTSGVLALGAELLGVILTGMGKDGALGAAQLAAAGAPLWCESASTAVINGMPEAAAMAHPRAVRLPLDHLGHLVALACGATGDPDA